MIERTINLVAAALGGEGGGVFTNWLSEVAEREGWHCQTTALAGVAQRTGATIYYLEFFPRNTNQPNVPVMSLFPAQGDIDIAVASEIAEAARMVQRGFVTVDRTTLIASDHRVYSIDEKQGLGDSTADVENLREVAGRYAKNFIHFDMLKLANDHGAVISAVLLGALAGSDVLPFSLPTYRDVIRSSGKATKINLAAFDASVGKARANGVEIFQPEVVPQPEFKLPVAQTTKGRKLTEKISHFPGSLQEVIYHGAVKCTDYQDHTYAQYFLAECEAVLDLDVDKNNVVTEVVARYLALWMCFEDIPRVAQLKTRLNRIEKIRSEVKAHPKQILYVTEFFSPRVEEMCAILPVWLGRSLLNSYIVRKVLNFLTGGKKLRTDRVLVFSLLRILAGFKLIRRFSLGYAHEHNMIRRWLDAVKELLKRDPERALALAKCGRLVKGYGQTRHRTSSQLMQIVDIASASSATEIQSMHHAALEDDSGYSLSKILETAA